MAFLQKLNKSHSIFFRFMGKSLKRIEYLSAQTDKKRGCAYEKQITKLFSNDSYQR